MILVIMGGSCSGKTEFALQCEKYGFPKVVTNTTRDRRIDDFEGSYHFLTKEEFFNKVKNGEMIEYAEYNGKYYGSSIDSLSKNCIIVLEPNGYRALKKKMPKQIYGIFLDVSDNERLRRGLLRGDKEDIIKSRIIEDKKLFNEKLKDEVNFVLSDISKEDIPKVIEANLETFYTN